MMNARIRACALAILVAVTLASASAQNAGPVRPKVALVLEGGGALGLAHVGVIKVIERLGIPVDIVVGTSMGAIVGGFYALGYDAARMEEVARGADWIDLFSEQARPEDERYRDRLDRSRYFARVDFDRRGLKTPGGLLTGRKILSFLDRLTIAAPAPVDFDALPRRYRAVAADVATGERVVLDSGSIADAMRASMSIPGVFAPYVLDGRRLVDGGVVDNLPIETARSLGADLIIAVHVVGGTPFSADEIDRNPLDALAKSLDILIRNSVLRQLPEADYVLTVDLTGYLMTDFAKAADILALGERTAEQHQAELEAFRARSGAVPTAERLAPRGWSCPVRAVAVEGVDPKERGRVEALFAPAVGTAPDDAVLKRGIDELERSGNYESIRVGLVPDGDGTILSVRLKRRPQPGHSLRIGLSYASTYSGSTASNRFVAPGIVLRGLTTADSRLSADAEFLDAPAFSAAFHQPFGGVFFAEAYFAARQNADAYVTDDADIGYLYQTRATSVGAAFGLAPTAWTELSAGFSYDWIGAERLPGIRAGADEDSLPMGHARFSVNAFDSPVFPTRGIGVGIDFSYSLAGTGGPRFFETAEIRGRVVPPLDIPFTLEFDWKVGTDFSKTADDARAAPPYYKPDLADRSLFPGPLKVYERIGSHVAGAGATAKWQLNWASRASGRPAFLIAQAAAGTALQDLADAERVRDYIHWTGALGLGLRINDGFGVSVRVGATRNLVDETKPFIALDIGALGW